MSYFHQGLDADVSYERRVEEYLIARKVGRYNRPRKVNDEYQP